jgi:hypothetical protein
MRILSCCVGSSVVALLAFQPASAANFSISFGQADFEMFYAATFDGETDRGKTADDFDYIDLGVSVDRGDYRFGFNVSTLLEQEVDEYEYGGDYIDSYDTERNSYSFSVSRNISEKLSTTVGYYSAELTVATNRPGQEDSTETDAFFASLTYADRLTDKLFWFGRFGAQINDADLEVNSNDGLVTASLDGDGIVFGAGIYYPLDATKGLTFASEHKDFTYDGGAWDLEESQTLLTIGYNFRF